MVVHEGYRSIGRLQAYLANTIASGTPAERKAAIETLVAELRITEEGVIPVFKIPGPRSPIRGENDTTDTNEIMVRAMVRPVGRTYQHANRDALVEGDLLPVRLRRSGTAKDAR